MKLAYDDAEDEIARLKERVTFLEGLVPSIGRKADYFEVSKAVLVVESLTARLFGEEFTRTECEDPEIVGDHYFVFRAIARGDVNSVLSKYNEWHAGLSEVPSFVRHLFRLSLDAQS